MSILDFFKRKTKEELEKGKRILSSPVVSSGINILKDTRQHVSDFLTGEDDEYRNLESNYKEKTKGIYDEKKSIIDAWNSKQIDEPTLNSSLDSIKQRLDSVIGSDEQLTKYALRRKEISDNNALNAIPWAGIEGKIAGKTRRLVYGIAKNTLEEKIIPYLKKFKISDELAKELAPKLAKETDEQLIYAMSKAGQTISAIEKRIGYLGKDIRSNLSLAISRIVKLSPDKESETKALFDLSKKTISGLFDKSILPVREQNKKLLGSLKSKLEDIHTFSTEQKNLESYGKTKDLIEKLSKEGAEITPEERIFAEDLLKKIETPKQDSLIQEARKFTNRGALIEKSNINPENLEIKSIGGKKVIVDKRTGEELVDITNSPNFGKDIMKRGLNPDASGKTYYHGTNENIKPEQFNRGFLTTDKNAAGKFGKNVIEVNPNVKNTADFSKSLSTGGVFDGKPVVRADFNGFDINTVPKELQQDFIKTAEKLGVKKQAVEIANILQDKEFIKSAQNKGYDSFNFKSVSPDGEVFDALQPLKSQPLQEGVKVEIPKVEISKVAKPKVVTPRQKLWKETALLIRQVKQKGKVGMMVDGMRKLKGTSEKRIGLKNFSSLRGATVSKLEQVKTLAQNVLKKGTEIKDVSKVDLSKMELPGTSVSKTKKFFQGVGQGLEKGLGVLSTNIKKYGGEKLMYRVRKKAFEINQQSFKQAKEIKDFIKGTEKLSKKWFAKKDYKTLVYSLFNQDFNTADAIANKRGFKEGFDKVKSVLADVHKRANDADIKVGKLQNYFPRIVNDLDGLMDAINKKYGQEGKGALERVLKTYADKKLLKVGELTATQKAEALTNYLRGYGGKINAGVGKAELARKIDLLDPEFIQYYKDPKNALLEYLQKMNEKIETKKLFGLEETTIDSIGTMVDGMDITPSKANRLKEVLYSALTQHGAENKALNSLRQVVTVTLLGHINNVITQFGDIAMNVKQHGLIRALGSMLRKKPFKRDELFGGLINEFSDTKFVTKVLKTTGFDAIDKLQNQGFMANVFRRGASLAKKGKGSNYELMTDKLRAMFRDKWTEALDDLKNKRITDKTKEYVFNETLDISPRDLMEMPEAYVNNPNARILYSMKSYSIKILDVYRNQVIREYREHPVKAVKNFITLTAILTMSGATINQIRDWYNGKKTDIGGNVANAMLNIALLSNYDTSKISQDGLGKTLMSKFLPPARFIDDISKDIFTAGDDKGLYSIRNIPIIGQEIYNRLGRGRASIEKANEQKSKIKKLPPLKKLKGLKTLDKL